MSFSPQNSPCRNTFRDTAHIPKLPKVVQVAEYYCHAKKHHSDSVQCALTYTLKGFRVPYHKVDRYTAQITAIKFYTWHLNSPIKIHFPKGHSHQQRKAKERELVVRHWECNKKWVQSELDNWYLENIGLYAKPGPLGL